MPALTYDFECVMLTTAATGTPHLAALKRANPGLVIHVCETQDAPSEDLRLDAWRNCDRNLREWWKTHRNAVATERVIFLEYDVFCNVDLRDVVPGKSPISGMVGAALKTPVRDAGWWPFREAAALPKPMQAFAVGMAPFAVLVVDRPALDAVADAAWDGLFEADVFCELRMPSLLRFLGFSVRGNRAWTAVGTTPQTAGKGFEGIMHPVKREVVP